jgi:hypothetical protein
VDAAIDSVDRERIGRAKAEFQAKISVLFMMNNVTISDDSNETMHTPSQLSKTYLSLYNLTLILN